MSLKLDANLSAVAHHVVDGPVTFPYAIDAHQAVSHHPVEWSMTPWSAEDASAARKRLGLAAPELTPEEQDAIDEHARAVAEANERLKVFKEKQELERVEAAQVAADQAMVVSPSPRPDPSARRPFKKSPK